LSRIGYCTLFTKNRLEEPLFTFEISTLLTNRFIASLATEAVRPEKGGRMRNGAARAAQQALVKVFVANAAIDDARRFAPLQLMPVFNK
jgi:hypothetical protein